MSSTIERTALTLTSRVRIAEGVLFQPLENEAVLLNLDSGVYFGLDPVGTRIWQLLAEHGLLADIARTIVAEYNVTDEQCAADLLTLVGDLERQGLVAVVRT